MSRQGQLKRIKKEMTHTQDSITTDDNHSEKEIRFYNQETLQPAVANQIENNFPPDTDSPPAPIPQPSQANDNQSIYHNIIVSDSDHDNEISVDEFVTNLKHWALKYQVTHVAISELLSIL